MNRGLRFAHPRLYSGRPYRAYLNRSTTAAQIRHPRGRDCEAESSSRRGERICKISVLAQKDSELRTQVSIANETYNLRLCRYSSFFIRIAAILLTIRAREDHVILVMSYVGPLLDRFVRGVRYLYESV